MIRGFDASAWQAGFTRRDFEELGATLGMKLYVCQLHGGGPDGSDPYLNPYAPGNLTAAVEAGWAVAGVCWPSWSWPAALDGIGGELTAKLCFLALDVEARAPAHVDQIRDLRDRQVQPWIYTSLSQWQAIMSGRTDFANVTLWDARWFARYNQNNWPQDVLTDWIEYGGWKTRGGWQINTLGVPTPSGMKTLDLDVFTDDTVPTPLPPPPDPLEELRARVAALESRVTDLDASVTSWANDTNNKLMQLTSVSGDLMRRVFQLEGWQGVVKIAAHDVAKER